MPEESEHPYSKKPGMTGSMYEKMEGQIDKQLARNEVQICLHAKAVYGFRTGVPPRYCDAT